MGAVFTAAAKPEIVFAPRLIAEVICELCSVDNHNPYGHLSTCSEVSKSITRMEELGCCGKHLVFGRIKTSTVTTQKSTEYITFSEWAELCEQSIDRLSRSG